MTRLTNGPCRFPGFALRRLKGPFSCCSAGRGTASTNPLCRPWSARHHWERFLVDFLRLEHRFNNGKGLGLILLRLGCFNDDRQRFRLGREAGSKALTCIGDRISIEAG